MKSYMDSAPSSEFGTTTDLHQTHGDGYVISLVLLSSVLSCPSWVTNERQVHTEHGHSGIACNLEPTNRRHRLTRRTWHCSPRQLRCVIVRHSHASFTTKALFRLQPLLYQHLRSKIERRHRFLFLSQYTSYRPSR